jgi:hypothetical protein
MTDPVRPVAPRESIEDWVVREARLIAGPRTHLQDSEALIQFGLRVAAYSPAAAPVPCAASPADIEQAFKAGYHCRWHRQQGLYCFDPAMSPGDPDGAYQAWLTWLRATGEGARDGGGVRSDVSPHGGGGAVVEATEERAQYERGLGGSTGDADCVPASVHSAPHIDGQESLLALQAYGEEESANAIKDKRQDDYRFWQGWNSALERALSILDAARLRGEATVRVEE